MSSVQFQNLVIVAIGLDGVVELVKEFVAVAGQEIEAADAALLQAFVGIERLAEHFRVAADQFALLRFRARGLRLKFFQLMLHLRDRGLRRIHQRAIQLLQLLADRAQIGRQRLIRGFECRLQILRQATRGELLAQRLGTIEHIRSR